MDNNTQINDIVIDVLREIGNIGAGHAATALSKLINTKVDMHVPKVSVVDISEVPDILGGAEKEICGIFFEIDGDIDGSIMFVLKKEVAFNLLSLLMGQIDAEFNEINSSALKEIGNILSGAYVSSLSGLTKLFINISTPSLAVDMAGAILSVPAIEYGVLGDKILIIENDFFKDDASESVSGYFFLIPDMDSYPKILESLGVQI